jgi:dGTPase
LDASTKYPWLRAQAPPTYGAHSDGTPRATSKFGVYDDDEPVFAWLREGAPEGRRCLEAQVMDLSDDIAYSVHDVEDGVVAGRIELTDLGDATLQGVWSTVREWYVPEAGDDDLAAALDRLRASDAWPSASYDGSRPSLAALKNLTSTLIGRFCQAATRATQDRFGDAALVRYAADLVVPDDTALEIAVLKGVAAQLVMRAEDRVDLLEDQRRVLRDLVEHLVRHPDELEAPFRHDLAVATDESARLRVVVDQVASLTDASALLWHAALG